MLDIPDPNDIFCDTTLHNYNAMGPFYLRLKFHVIRDGNGNGGQTVANVHESYRLVRKAFEPHNIYFVWDCDINYIDNDTSYAASKCSPNHFEHTSRSRFDVFLYPDNDSLNDGSGQAPWFQTTRSCVIGNDPMYPHLPLARTYVVAHELGHNLGLFHTHTHAEIAPEVNEVPALSEEYCHIGGDCVCDTPVEPCEILGLWEDVTYPGCDWIGEGCEYDEEAGYNPDTRNIMSYSNSACLKYFSAGQGQRMRNMLAKHIETYDSLSYPAIEVFSVAVDSTINLTSHPSGELWIDGMLVIENDSTLTISADITVYMGHMAKITIEPGGRLNLYGTLTSGNCFNSKIWKGIEVQGNPAMSQQFEEGAYHQGRFFAYPGSKIENALTALKLWGPTLDDTGGQASCTGTSFLNNVVAVDIKPYNNYKPSVLPAKQQLPYRANFTKCQFFVDNNYPHLENFSKLVSLFGVHGITFRGCTFDNQMSIADPLDAGAFGYGIKADFSTFTVTQICNGIVFPCPDWQKSTFKNLGYGILASGALANPWGNVQIEHSVFENNYVGISLGSTHATRILFNEFEMTTLPDFEVWDFMVGVAITGPTSFIMEENEMNAGYISEVTTIGTAIIHTGPFSNVIRKNTLDGLDYNHYSSFTNANNADAYSQGLHYLCNRNENSEAYDHYVYDIGFIRQLQGDVDDQNEVFASGNLFSKTGSSTERDFANYGEGDVDYYYFDQEANQTPEDYQGIEIFPSDENTCPQRFFGPPTEILIAHTKGKYDEDRPDFEYAVSQYLHYEHSNPSEAAYYKLKATYHRQQMDTLSMAGLLYNLHDTMAYDLDSIYAWKMRYHNPYAYMQLANWQFFAGEEQAAYRLLDELDQEIDLDAEMESERDDLINLLEEIEGHTPGQYPQRVLDELEIMAYSQPSIAMFLARDLLTLQGFHFPPLIYLNSSHRPPGEEDIAAEENKQDMEYEPSYLRVYPNPAQNEINVKWQVTSTNSEFVDFELFNILGTRVGYHTEKINSGIILYKVNHLPSGLYFYKFTSGIGKIYSGSIQIQR